MKAFRIVALRAAAERVRRAEDDLAAARDALDEMVLNVAGVGETFDAIGEVLGLSRQRVGQMATRAKSRGAEAPADEVTA